MMVCAPEPDADLPPSHPSPKEELQSYMNEFEKDPSFLQDMLKGFSAEAPRRMAKAGEAFSHGDFPAAARAAHSLVSMFGAVRITSLAEAARKLEHHLREGELKPAKFQLDFLEKNLDAVLRHVEAVQRDRKET